MLRNGSPHASPNLGTPTNRHGQLSERLPTVAPFGSVGTLPVRSPGVQCRPATRPSRSKSNTTRNATPQAPGQPPLRGVVDPVPQYGSEGQWLNNDFRQCLQVEAEWERGVDHPLHDPGAGPMVQKMPMRTGRSQRTSHPALARKRGSRSR